ncbi:MAG: cytochrome c [Acidimicrobiaceae bacterium]|nr:cytochrome c [Acidimicrobiaceae bacterium]MCO5331752.1 cytochrome c [Ilumatobacteraceae bacterium]
MLALNTTAVAWVILTVILLGWVGYYILNNFGARRELGSEVEMAPNRKPYYDDDTLEGPRLERMQLLGVLLLITMVIGLPLYWVLEPGRQAGAQDKREEEFITWGAELFAPTAEGGFNCAGCHGAKGVGGVAAYTLTDPRTGEVRAVNWAAPALNTVYYRFSEEEVRFILNYGRPFSPMSAWGAPGGGPMTVQNIDTLLAYLESIQLEPEDCAEGQDPFRADGDPAVCDGGMVPQATQDEIQKAVDNYLAANPGASEGEALFNLELASGAYSCARCHTQGWSYGDPGVTGQGGMGWNLTGGSTASHFPNEADMISFISAGSKNGAKYGQQGQGSGKMPAFGHLLTEDQIKAIVEYVRSL